MGLTVEQIILAATVLIREAIESQNYVAGVSGWSIFANGDSEFNNGTFRGVVIVGTPPTTVEISDVLPPELQAYYVPTVFTDLSSAYIRLNPGDGSYSYVLSGANTTANYSGWVIGQVAADLTVKQHLFGQYFPNTDVTQINVGDPSLDFRSIIWGFTNFKDNIEFDNPVTHFDDVTIDDGLLLLELSSAGQVLNAQLDTDAQARYTVDTSGAMSWGTGAAAPDTALSRTAVNTLTTAANLVVPTDIKIGIKSQGRGVVATLVRVAIITTGAVAATEYAGFVIPSTTYLTGRAYAFVIGWGKIKSAVVNNPALNIRTWTGIAPVPGASYSGGVILINGPRYNISGTAIDMPLVMSPKFVVAGGSNVTTGLVLTVGPSVATAVVLDAAATAGGQVTIEVIDIGAAADYAGYPSL